MAAQRGNALFLILIAVALFAALSYAVTQSGRGSGNIDKEQAKLKIAAIQNYAAQLSQAVTRLIVTGCPGENISFYSASWPVSAWEYSNPKAPADKSCDVFDPAGGGVSWQDPSKGLAAGISQPLVTGSIGVAGIGGGCNNSILFIAAVTRDMCLEINKQAGVINTGGNPPQWEYATGKMTTNWTKYGWQAQAGSNNMGCGVTVGSGSPSASELTGKPVGCYQSSGGDLLYQAYTVLFTNAK